MIKNRGLFLLALSLFIFLRSYAQSDTLRLYYDTNETELKNKSLRLDSLLSVSNRKILGITVQAYADYPGSPEYNLALSSVRAGIVKDYLSRQLASASIKAEGFGEVSFADKESPSGDPQSRRVEVIIGWESMLVKEVSEPPISANPEVIVLKIDTTVEKLQGIATEKKLSMLPGLKAGDRISLDDLLFIGNRHYLVRESLRYPDVLLKVMKQNAGLKIELVGHIAGTQRAGDGFDEDSRDYHLSLNRAKLIYDYLLKNGVTADRMSYRGVGSSEPRFSPPGDQRNRRVEIVVMENIR